MIISYICFFFFGAVLASFINATIYRIDNHFKYPDIFVKSSHCEECKHPLSWVDLFPIIGFLINKGKCKYCGAKVNSYYPISEFVLGLAFLILFLYSIPYYYFLIVLFLFVLSTYDIKEMGIPKTLTHIFLLICIAIFLLFSLKLENLIIPTIIVIAFIIINLIKKSFGIGDMLVIFGIGILLTQSQCLAFFWIAIIIALIYSFVLAIFKRKHIKGMKVPMVPFLSLAFVITLVYGESIWNFLLKFMGI